MFNRMMALAKSLKYNTPLLDFGKSEASAEMVTEGKINAGNLPAVGDDEVIRFIPTTGD